MLTNRRAVVTGSTSGIGLGIARALASEGCAVMLNGFGEAGEIEDLRRSIGDAAGADAAYCNADMSKPEEAARLIREAEEKFGGVDILVNNAGVQHVDLIEDFPPEKWDLVLAINLSSAFHAIRAAIPGLKSRGWGRIINIASAHGLVASPAKSAYVAAKHGIVGLTKTVALETAGSGITCNAICPGWVRTPLVERQIRARAEAAGITVDEATLDLVGEKHPNRAFVEIEQVAALAVFLCGDAAASITGSTQSIDGGWVAQ